ncbi:hypothetical protein ATKI12_7703 [Kitasatospora sp. Ki12]
MIRAFAGSASTMRRWGLFIDRLFGEDSEKINSRSARYPTPPLPPLRSVPRPAGPLRAPPVRRARQREGDA